MEADSRPHLHTKKITEKAWERQEHVNAIAGS